MAFISEEFRISDGMGLELATERFKVSGKSRLYVLQERDGKDKV